MTNREKQWKNVVMESENSSCYWHSEGDPVSSHGYLASDRLKQPEDNRCFVGP